MTADANNDVDLWTPLIDHDLYKADCLAMLRRAGIELPTMYAMGYRNNNCLGCVKGGSGYWNKVRVDFPEVFQRMSDMEQKLGRTVCKETIDGVRQRVFLKDLSPEAGRYEAEPDIECGIFCHMASQEAA